MLTLFKYIRRRLLSKNKLITYLLYAIGEILLVVIGILIAVQIDNWNDERKINQSVNDHLLILKQNLKEDAAQLEQLKISMKDSKNASDSLIKQMQTIVPVDDKINKHLITLLYEFQFSPNTNAQETLTQSGEIPYLSLALQKSILDYYSLIDRVRERENISNNQIQGKYEVHFNEKYAYVMQKGNQFGFYREIYENDPRSAVPFDEEQFLADKHLEALLMSRIYQTTKLFDFYEELLRECQALLVQIDQEIR